MDLYNKSRNEVHQETEITVVNKSLGNADEYISIVLPYQNQNQRNINSFIRKFREQYTQNNQYLFLPIYACYNVYPAIDAHNPKSRNTLLVVTTPRDPLYNYTVHKNIPYSENIIFCCYAFTKLVYNALLHGFSIHNTPNERYENIVYMTRQNDGVVFARVAGILPRIPATHDTKRIGLIESFNKRNVYATKQIKTKGDMETLSKLVLLHLTELHEVYKQLNIPTEVIDNVFELAEKSLHIRYKTNPATIHLHEKKFQNKTSLESLYLPNGTGSLVKESVREKIQEHVGAKNQRNDSNGNVNDTIHAIQNRVGKNRELNYTRELQRILENHKNNGVLEPLSLQTTRGVRGGRGASLFDSTGTIFKFPKIRGFTFAPSKDWVGRKH